jgi:H+/Cl- antiporter ClcA
MSCYNVPLLGFIVAKQVKKEPMISGSGIPQVEGILTRRLKMNWFSILYNKFIGGLICLAVGLSVGREGPSVQMGACIGEGISNKFRKFENEEKKHTANYTKLIDQSKIQLNTIISSLKEKLQTLGLNINTISL